MFILFSKLFGNKHLIIIMLSLIILFIIMGITKDRQLTWPEKFIKDTISFTQGILYKPASAVAGFFEDVRSYSLVFEENKVLKESLHQYSQVVAELNQLKEENTRLREMLEFRNEIENQYQLRIAQVIGRSPDRWNNSIIINQGSKDGIEKDMAVITSQGFIGKVSSVSSFSANVRLITDIEHSGFVFAAIQSDPITYGVIEGYDSIKDELRVTKISLNARIETGQLVTTSNLGGVFPTGLVIGEVVRIEEGENGGLTKTIYVKPSADLYHLNEVFVVTNNNNQNSEIDELEGED